MDRGSLITHTTLRRLGVAKLPLVPGEIIELGRAHSHLLALGILVSWNEVTPHILHVSFQEQELKTNFNLFSNGRITYITSFSEAVLCAQLDELWSAVFPSIMYTKQHFFKPSF